MISRSDNRFQPAEVADRADEGPLLEIRYFTDPLCCWSWGYEPQIRRLRYAFSGQIAWMIRMGGMIGDWQQFQDPVNSIHRPGQMGPVWLHAQAITGMPVAADVWANDPPGSSFPASLAVRCAGLQSPKAADLLLRRLWQALIAEGRNTAREEVVLAVVRGLVESRPGVLDLDRFLWDLGGAEARSALENDVRAARALNIRRFPTLILRRAGASRYLVGWRPFSVLVGAVRSLAPELGPERLVGSASEYDRYWSGVTDRELAEVAPLCGIQNSELGASHS